MKSSLTEGLSHSATIDIDEERVIFFMGDECRVYSTPNTIRDVEITCRNLLLAHLDPGEDSVGTRVNWEHVGPALFGAKATIAVKIIKVDGRRVTFEASVTSGGDDVARGTHERFVVDIEKVRERLLKKRSAQGQRPPSGP
ncbi:MAG: LysR family transcriptional regulator [Betaproteobacteria bacterium]|nr:LysR family transcriptional regulator [Betaproteobacteria bacterium]